MTVPDISTVPWMAMLPAGVLPGAWTSSLLSMKIKLSGSGFQTSGLTAPGVLLTLIMFRLNRVPEPESGVKSSEKADTRSVRIGPAPGRTFPETFQLLAVSPVPETGGLWKVTTVSSKVKSPWNPTRLAAGLIAEVSTG